MGVRTREIRGNGAVFGVETDSVKEERERYVSKDGRRRGYSLKLWLLEMFNYFLPVNAWEM